MSRQGKDRKRTYHNIRGFWNSEAEEWGNCPQVTIRDHYFRVHELNTLLSIIPTCGRLLDLGCGTGFGTSVLSRKSGLTIGVDYTEEMIRWANKLLQDESYRNAVFEKYSPLWISTKLENITFKVGDVLNLVLDEPRFDVITGQRILINMPDHKSQLIALENMRKYAQDHTMLVLIEATRDGHARTDTYRSEMGLPKLEKYWHNFYVEEDKFASWQSVGWYVKAVLTFDTYMLLSKVIYPAACGQDNCKFLSGANRAAMEISNLFRTRSTIDEIGFHNFLELYCHRVGLYDKDEGRKIQEWLKVKEDDLSEWRGLGHQKLILADAC